MRQNIARASSLWTFNKRSISKKCYLYRLAATKTIILLLSLLSAQEVNAYPEFRRWAAAHFQQPVSCITCHERDGGTMRNEFGKQWENAGISISALNLLRSKDADGDGFSNWKEILAQSNPGEAMSTPSQIGNYNAKYTNIVIPSDQLELVMPDAEKYAVAELNLRAPHLSRLKNDANLNLTQEQKYPTIYFAIQNGKRTHAAMFGHVTSEDERASMLLSIDLRGSIHRISLFQSPEVSPGKYRAYLDCLVGKDKTQISPPGTKDCPAVKASQHSQDTVFRLIKMVLWTFHVSFSGS